MATAQRFSARSLTEFTATVLTQLGLDERDARIGAEILIDADLMGIDSHGIAHLNTHRGYAPGLRTGVVKPNPELRILRETASTALLDGDGGFGLIVGYRAMEHAIEKARTAGSGWVSVTHSRHFGAAGYYALMAVPEDMIGIAMCNAGPWVVPTYGRRPMIGTNPIAFAAPAGEEQPFLFDMATSAVAMGKLEIAEREGKPIPEGWALDEMGQPTINVQRVRRGGGGLTPLGSQNATSSYKGYGLGLMVDVLCGVLSGAGYSMILDRPVSEAGQFFGALRLDGFRDPGQFRVMMDGMQHAFRTAETVDGAERVLLPGQREFETRAERERNGIPLHASVIESLRSLAEDLGIPAPEAIEGSAQS